MMENHYTRDPIRRCPDCGERDCQYSHISGFKRVYTIVDDNHDEVEHVDSFGEARDYHCTNCDCEFTLTCWEKD